jgi:hypothetical protein
VQPVLSSEENKVESWLELLLRLTEESESPERYFWWSGLATISAMVRKNVFLDRFYYKLYPNIYVALVSSRSGTKKGIPISICKSLLEECSLTRIISGCNSVQALIQELSTQKTFPNGLVINEAQGIMMSDEFEAFLTEDPRALTYLTALFNTHEHEVKWTKHLKGSPIEELRAPCLTLLVASNEVLFDSVVKQKDIEGGFIARTFIVHEKKQKRINPLVFAPKIKFDRQALIVRLLQISKIKGEFKWSKEAGELYTEWYTKLCELQLDDRTGSVGRLGDQVLKVTMLISLSYKDTLEISVPDLVLAIKKSEECLPALNIVTLSGLGSGDISNHIALVLKTLINSPEQTISRQKLLARLHPKGVDSQVLDRVVESLFQSHAIEQPFRRGKEVFYKMKKKAYEKYIQFKGEEGWG